MLSQRLTHDPALNDCSRQIARLLTIRSCDNGLIRAYLEDIVSFCENGTAASLAMVIVTAEVSYKIVQRHF